MSIIQQLQEDIVNPEVSLAPILRRAKILAYRLRHDEFKTWIDSELNGYPDKDSIPRYRRFTAHNYGYFANAFHHMNNASIPTINLPDPIKEFMQELDIDMGVGSLEDLMDNPDMRKDGAVKSPWLSDVVAVAAQYQIYKNMNLLDAWKVISSNQVMGILEAVRNKLLAFILELQDSFPELAESDDRIGEVPLDQTTNIFNTHIHGNQNVVAAGANITQDVRQVVRSNDLSSLLSYLKSIGVPEADTQELKEAVEEDGPREKSAGLGPRVSAWLVKKIPEWGVNAAMSSTIPMVFKALEQFNG